MSRPPALGKVAAPTVNVQMRVNGFLGGNHVVTARRRVVNCRANKVQVGTNDTPSGNAKHHNRDFPARQILLVSKIPICRQQKLKTSLFRQSQQLAI